jgi:hypothetical protein
MQWWFELELSTVASSWLKTHIAVLPIQLELQHNPHEKLRLLQSFCCVLLCLLLPQHASSALHCHCSTVWVEHARFACSTLEMELALPELLHVNILYKSSSCKLSEPAAPSGPEVPRVVSNT